MLSIPNVLAQIRSALDSEGSDYYTWDRDLKPALQYAQDSVAGLISQARAIRKESTESLRDLIFTRVWLTSQYSRVLLLPDQEIEPFYVWEIDEVICEPTITPATNLPAPSKPENSVLMLDRSYISGGINADRLTLDEWLDNEKNPFKDGNTFMQDNSSMKSYAYRELSTYLSTNYNPDGVAPKTEIQIRPALSNQPVAITYLQYPNAISAEDGNIQLPPQLLSMVVSKALQFISIKQGDQTTVNTESRKEVAELMAVLS